MWGAGKQAKYTRLVQTQKRLMPFLASSGKRQRKSATPGVVCLPAMKKQQTRGGERRSCSDSTEAHFLRTAASKPIDTWRAQPALEADAVLALCMIISREPQNPRRDWGFFISRAGKAEKHWQMPIQNSTFDSLHHLFCLFLEGIFHSLT